MWVGRSGSLYQIICELIKLRSCQIHIKMKRSVCIHADKWQINIGGCRRGKFLLCLFSRLLQTLHRHLVTGEINAVLRLELAHHPTMSTHSMSHTPSEIRG